VKKLFTILFLLLASGAQSATTDIGLFFRTNCDSILNPVDNATVCNQTTTASGRTAGHLYVRSSSAWADVTTVINNMVGDSGSGGTKGLVPAPGAGDAAAGKFLKANGLWDIPAGSGSGDFVGPASATDGAPVLFNGTTGKLGKNSTPTGTGNPVLQTSPTLTTPKITTSLLDTNGNPLIAISPTASAVDGITITNAATANPATVSLAATGSDSNVNLQLSAKGTGAVIAGDCSTNCVTFDTSAVSGSKTVTIPNANSTTVQALDCTGTGHVLAISASGVISCSADSGGSGTNNSVRLQNSTAQSTTGGVTATLTFDTEIFDNGAMHTGSGSRITAPTTGDYLIGANVEWSASSGVTFLWLNLNGTSVIARTETSVSQPAIQEVSTLYHLTAGDYVEAMVQTQTNADIQSTDLYSPIFFAKLLN